MFLTRRSKLKVINRNLVGLTKDMNVVPRSTRTHGGTEN